MIMLHYFHSFGSSEQKWKFLKLTSHTEDSGLLVVTCHKNAEKRNMNKNIVTLSHYFAILLPVKSLI